MKAVQFDKFGGPDVLHVTDVPEPQPPAGKVRIRVHAAGVSATDTKIRSGQMNFGQSLPMIPGGDVAGVVDRVGADVTDVKVGDRVFGVAHSGATAEYAILDFYAPIPASLGFVDAAALPVALETATRGLDQLRVTVGATVFINGASGGIGSTATQLAVAKGARVIGAASEANQAYLRMLGAEPVVYGAGMVDRVRALAPGGIDAALDVAGNGILDQLIALTGTAKTVVTLADFAGAEQYGVHFSNGFADGHRFDAMTDIHTLIQAGRFWLPVDRTFPLQAAADAHRASETGRVRGRLVILVQ